MMLRQQSVDPARTRRHLLSVAPRECSAAARYSAHVWIGWGCGGYLTYDLGIPRDIC
jgi:hypothetical protein